MKVLIKRISHEAKVGKSGKPFESCKILTTNSQGQDTWLSGFGSEVTHTWRAGHTVDVELKQNEKGYWNFDLTNESTAMPSEELELLRKIDKKLDIIFAVKKESNEIEILDETCPF